MSPAELPLLIAVETARATAIADGLRIIHRDLKAGRISHGSGDTLWAQRWQCRRQLRRLLAIQRIHAAYPTMPV